MPTPNPTTVLKDASTHTCGENAVPITEIEAMRDAIIIA